MSLRTRLAAIVVAILTGLAMLYAAIFVVVNVFVDLSYAWLDPRIRY